MTLLLVAVDGQQAEESPRDNPCEDLTRASDVLRCASENHPAVRQAMARFRSDHARIDAENSWINPEVEGEVMSGPSAEIAYLHTFELGDRRHYRTEAARQASLVSHARVELARQNSVLEISVALTRLRQLYADETYLNQMLFAYRQAIARFQRGAVLTPERRASAMTLRMAMRSTTQQLTANQVARDELEAHTRLLIGHAFDPDTILTSLRPANAPWPEVTAIDPDSSEVTAARSEQALATARIRMEESQVWPRLQIGPRIAFSTSESNSLFGSSRSNETEFGVAFRFDIPLYHQNEASVQSAEEEAEAAGVEAQFAEERVQHQFEHLQKSYAMYRDLLARSENPAQIANERRLIQAYVSRGSITPSTLVGFYSAQLDYLESYNALELRTAEAYWKLLALSGTILEEANLRTIDASAE